jgi:CRP/FNR family transcriptional regulator, cyclic AMP receptor protein
LPTDADILAEVPLFHHLSDTDRARLAARIDVERVRAGTQMFGHGDPGGSMFVVRAGLVELFFKNDTGERITLETVGPGQFFGEISLLDGGARTTAAEVKEDLEALVVDRGDLEELMAVSPTAAMSLLAAAGERLRNTVNILRHTTSRNPNVETEDKRTTIMRVADWISAFSGSMPFLFIHLVLFTVWIGLNVGPLARTAYGGWDGYPFGLLTMAVSLEAIILSVFVLLSQNRQIERDRVRNDIEYEVNVKAELQIAHMHEKVDNMYAAILARLDREQADRGSRARDAG